MSKNLATRNTQLSSRSFETTDIIVVSVLCGAALVTTSLLLMLVPFLRRRRGARARDKQQQVDTEHSPSRQAGDLCPMFAFSEPPRTLAPFSDDEPTVRLATPSPRRLAIDASAPPFTTHWHVEKTGVHTPSDHHPAVTFRGNIFTSPSRHVETAGEEQQQQQHERPQECLRPPPDAAGDADESIAPGDASAAGSVSSAFAAEMSSLLESISLRSSYSSLRSGGLAAPPRVRARRQLQLVPAPGSDDGGLVTARSVPTEPSLFGISEAQRPGVRGTTGPLGPRPASQGVYHRTREGKWRQGEDGWRTW